MTNRGRFGVEGDKDLYVVATTYHNDKWYH